MHHPIRVYLTCFFILFVILSTNVFSKEKYIKPEDIVPILDEIDSLNKRLDNLEQKNTNDKLPESSKELLDLLKNDIEELSEVLERVETKSIVDRLEIGAEIRTRLDWYSFNGHDNIPYTGHPTGKKLNERIRLQPSNRFRLNLKANISDNLKFTSRLIMLRHWSDDDFPVYPDVNFLNTTRIPGDINLKVERAYVDFFFEPFDKLPMALTFGRVPSTDGLPADLRENTPRKSTYPAIAYDVEADAIGLSFDLEQLTKLPKSALRLVVAVRNDDNEQYILGHKVSDKKGIFRIDEKAMKPIQFCVLQFETNFPDIFGGLLAIFNILHIPKAQSPEFRYNEDLAVFYDETDDNNLLYATDHGSLGYLTKYTLFIESKRFFGFNFDWFVGLSYMKTHAKSAHQFMFNPRELGQPFDPIPAHLAFDQFKNLIENNPTYAAQYQALQNVPPPIGLLNNDGVSDHDGHVIHVGGRINLPLKIKNCPKFGIEYNHGSRYWGNFGNASEDPLNKLSIRGEVWDAYLLQPISRYFLFRLGHTVARHDYEEPFNYYYGEPMPIDHKVTNTYFLMDAKF